MATAGVRRDVGQAMCRHRLSWPVARKITFAWTLFLPSVFTRTIPRLSCTPAESTSDFGHSSGTSPTYSVDLAIGSSAVSHGRLIPSEDRDIDTGPRSTHYRPRLPGFSSPVGAGHRPAPATVRLPTGGSDAVHHPRLPPEHHGQGRDVVLPVSSWASRGRPAKRCGQHGAA